MRKKISGLVVALGAVLLPLSLAHAAEVTQIYTNNLFANANFTDADGKTTSVTVSREKGKGAPVDTINVSISGPDGFGSITGILPKNALRITASKASVDVDLADIQVTDSFGTPPEGVVSVGWTATDVSRTSGSVKFDAGSMSFAFVGTSTFSGATITGSVDGTDMSGGFGFVFLAHTSVIIHISTNP